MDFMELQRQLRKFADDRNWDQFHSPKNLSMALCVEAAELLEHFQWLTEGQSRSLDSVDRNEIAAEIADIQIFLMMLADKLGVDIDTAVNDKINRNAVKYPPTDSPSVRI